MSDLPPFYFRVRDNGAQVFRVNSENRQRRLEFEVFANVNVNNGQIRAQGDHVISDEERLAIEDWMAKRIALLAARDMDDIHRAIDHMNLTAQWAQSRATPEQLEEVTDALLMAMHDLRSVLVRKKADRMMPPEGGTQE